MCWIYGQLCYKFVAINNATTSALPLSIRRWWVFTTRLTSQRQDQISGSQGRQEISVIRHVFMWQAAEMADKSAITELLAQLSDRLPVIRSWELGTHSGEPNENGDPWDGALITDFDSWEDLESYSSDPFHEEIVKQLLPMVRNRAVVDFVREVGHQ